jgi:hypothetical protein
MEEQTRVWQEKTASEMKAQQEHHRKMQEKASERHRELQDRIAEQNQTIEDKTKIVSHNEVHFSIITKTSCVSSDKSQTSLSVYI